jgi:hypothetical protein
MEPGFPRLRRLDTQQQIVCGGNDLACWRPPGIKLRSFHSGRAVLDIRFSLYGNFRFAVAGRLYLEVYTSSLSGLPAFLANGVRDDFQVVNKIPHMCMTRFVILRTKNR